MTGDQLKALKPGDRLKLYGYGRGTVLNLTVAKVKVERSAHAKNTLWATIDDALLGRFIVESDEYLQALGHSPMDGSMRVQGAETVVPMSYLDDGAIALDPSRIRKLITGYGRNPPCMPSRPFKP